MKFFLISKFKENYQIVKDYLSKVGTVTDSILECDIIVSIGGDGTLLNAGKKAIEFDKPVLGINAGHLGYLCAFKIDEISSLNKEDFINLKESPRTLIEYQNNIAINDICVLKANPAQSIEVDVNKVARWKGDGVIISTATGSSSYNQSAGGPLLDPLSDELVVTPVCPHFSSIGSQIIKDNEIKINVSLRNPFVVTIDNKVINEVKEEIIINKSNKKLRLLIK